MATAKMTKPGTKAHRAKMEKLAIELRKWLLDNRMWVDTRIYFNGKAFATSRTLPNGKTEFAYNDPNNLIVLEEVDPALCMDYYNRDTITMSFEGPLYEALNYGDGAEYEALRKMFEKYGYYFEQGNAWNLSAYEI